MEGTLMVDGNFQVALPWRHDPPFSGADPGIFDWGVQTLVQKGLLIFFVANYFSPHPLLPIMVVRFNSLASYHVLEFYSYGINP